MIVSQNNVHSKIVEEWQTKAAKGLTSTQKVQLLEKAIKVVEARATQTISRVTLVVILDRVLYQSKDKYPCLSKATVDSNTISFAELYSKNFTTDFTEALLFFLVEFLTILGRITSDILTTPLHEELLKVTWAEPEKK